MGDPPAVPAEVGLLTAGVDVQGDRLEYVVTGWGEGERAVILEYGQVEGDPGQETTWDALTAALVRERSGLRVQAVAADTGYRPEVVWKWSERRLPFRVYPVKGQDGRGKLLVQKPGAVTHKRTRRPWMVGTDTAKDSLAARLRSAPDGPQGIRFADTLAPEFYDHLTAEKLTTKYVGSRPTRKWELIPGRRNEGLDCTVYALAALHALGVAVIQQLGALAEKRRPQPPRAPDEPPAPENRRDALRAARTQAPPRRGWVNRWK
jgi:phage terminase large subunit GpA-like protein